MVETPDREPEVSAIITYVSDLTNVIPTKSSITTVEYMYMPHQRRFQGCSRYVHGRINIVFDVYLESSL